MIRVFIVFTICGLCNVFLGACSDAHLDKNLGKGTNQLQKSPCACLPIAQKWQQEG